MKIIPQIDSKRFESNMAALARAVGVDVSMLVKGESKLLAAQAMVLQQPYGKGAKQRKMIEGAVEKGFRRTIKPVFASGKGGGKNEWHSPELQKPIRRKKREQVRAAFQKMGGRMTGATVVPFNKDIHKKGRWQRKLAKNDYRVYTLDTADWKRRLRVLKKRAGYIKAGWARAYGQLGGWKVPKWIGRHQGYAKGSADTKRLYTANPVVIFGAPSVFSDDTRLSFVNAVNRRANMMAKKLQNILKGYSYAWKNGSLAVWKPKPDPEAEAA